MPASTRRRRTRTRTPPTTATVPRPPNSFILFRQEYVRLYGGQKTLQSTMSKDAGEAWRALSDEDKQYYKDLAAVEKEKHMAKYPDYTFRPQRKEVKEERTVLVDSERAWACPPAPEETAPLPQSGPSWDSDPGHGAPYSWPSSVHPAQYTQELDSHLQQYSPPYASNNVDAFNNFEPVQFFGILLPPPFDDPWDNNAQGR